MVSLYYWPGQVHAGMRTAQTGTDSATSEWRRIELPCVSGQCPELQRPDGTEFPMVGRLLHEVPGAGLGKGLAEPEGLVYCALAHGLVAVA